MVLKFTDIVVCLLFATLKIQGSYALEVGARPGLARRDGACYPWQSLDSVCQPLVCAKPSDGRGGEPQQLCSGPLSSQRTTTTVVAAGCPVASSKSDDFCENPFI